MIKLDPIVVAKNYALLADNLDNLAIEYIQSFGIDPDKILVSIEIPSSITRETYKDLVKHLAKNIIWPIEQPKQTICFSLTSWAELQKKCLDFQYVKVPILEPNLDTYPSYNELNRVIIEIDDIVFSSQFRASLVTAVEKAVKKVIPEENNEN